jgi:putative MATE family efflux protein
MVENTTNSNREKAVPRNWTQGSIIRNLFSLSWPMVLTSTFTMIGPTVDMIWVGKLGSNAIAGVGVAGMVVMLVNSIAMGLFTGMQAIIARSIGANDERSGVHTARQAVLVSVGFAVIMAVIGILFSRSILILLGISGDVVDSGTPYLQILFIGTITISCQMFTSSTMTASGDSITPMKISLFYRLVQITLCPFLVFGWSFFPRMGVPGAALSQVIAQFIGLSLGMWVLISGRSRLKLTFSHFRVDFPLIWRLVKIGIPTSISTVQSSMSQLVLLALVAPFGTAAVAAHTLNQRVEAFLFMPIMGVGMGAGILAAQNLGAHQPQRAEKTGWLAAGVVEIFTILGAVLVLVWAEHLVRIFNSDPEVVKTASSFLRIATMAYMTMGMVVSFQQCISGVGDTMPPMIISLVISWAIQLPLAYLLSKYTGMGVFGVRWGMAAGMVIGAIAFTIYFKTGRWKRKRV